MVGVTFELEGEIVANPDSRFDRKELRGVPSDNLSREDKIPSAFSTVGGRGGLIME